MVSRKFVLFLKAGSLAALGIESCDYEAQERVEKLVGHSLKSLARSSAKALAARTFCRALNKRERSSLERIDALGD
jgi:hypothetical protein